MALFDNFKYPVSGFHFVVYFNGLLPNPVDLSFQSVSGLSVTVETEAYTEGGENRFVHEIPKGLKFSTLTLKRGLKAAPSSITKWCEDAYESFTFKPLNLIVMLLNEKHIPIKSWNIVGAYPIKYELGDFNAETNSILIETLELKYNYFKALL
ncbi:phage tail protein [Kordia jejudonensis]|uniref:phage tail protein n=1 Tax=Kordia jejudonensis TaxID=1348245 RepID=UPI000629C79C|nr:phage tail protein [Kordia jejudonensis]